MQKGFLSALKKILADRHRRRVWLRVVSGLMAVVVFCTTYALILPGITLERKTYCGLEEHTHTEDCYETVEVEGNGLICTPESEAEFVIHTHDDMCYENGELICTLPETEEHEHNDDCYSVTKVLTCDLEESEGHTHTDECYEHTTGDLICDDASPEHTHDDSCYEDVEELICDQEESEGHTHDDSCYTEEKELVCDIPEVVEHIHDSSCESGGVLVCGKPQVIKHQHTAECFAKNNDKSGEADKDGDKKEANVEEKKVLKCGLKEHTHTEECYQKSESSSGGGGNTEKTTVEGTTETTTATGDEKTETTTTESQDDLSFPYSDENVSGVISLPWSKDLPTDLTCKVVTVTSDDTDYNNLIASIDKEIANSSKEIESVLLYKLEWYTGENGDELYTLPEDVKPTVQFTKLDVSDDSYVEGVVISDETNEESEDEKDIENKDNNKEDDKKGLLDTVLSAFSLDDDDDDNNNDNEDISIGNGNVKYNNYKEPTDLEKLKNNEYPDVHGLERVKTLDGIENPKATDLSEALGIRKSNGDNVLPDGLKVPEDAMLPEDYSITEYSIADASDETYTAELVNPYAQDDNFYAELTNTGIFALSVVSDSSYGSGGYYKRITDTSQITSTGKYLLVAQNGAKALRCASPTVNYSMYYTGYVEYWEYNGYYYPIRYSYYKHENQYNSKDVEIQRVSTSVKSDSNNNPEYYRIVDANDNDTAVTPGSSSYSDCFWNITSLGSDQYYFTKAGSTSNVLSIDNALSFYDDVNTTFVFNINLFKKNNDTTWAIGASVPTYGYDVYGTPNYQTTDYNFLNCNGTAINQKGNPDYTQFLIYEYVSDDVSTESDIKAAASVKEKSTVEIVEEEEEKMVKPDCARYVTVTGARSIEDTFDVNRIFEGAEIKADSDPSTSQIESEFCLNDGEKTDKALFKEQKENDGRLLTDKSVIYGEDDYNAIKQSDYQKGDFSVALSALGQEWSVTEAQEEKTPIDVVIIYDLSASMKYEVNDTSNEKKWEASSNAVNTVMKEIYEANSKNRVGVVAFSNVGMDVLPIGRYSADDDKIFTYTENSVETGYKTLKVSDSLRDGYKTDANVSESKYKGFSLNQSGMWDLTNTQWGLQQAYEMFKTVKDTKTTFALNNKEVTRQPVIILLTDGDPTYCTYNYMNPKMGPTYGDGSSIGIEGYYTVLSANYFKNLTSIHYDKDAAFYTIGMGIKDSGYGSFYEDVEFNPYTFLMQADHSYMRAVLDPTPENIAALDDYSRHWDELAKDKSATYAYYYSVNSTIFKVQWQVTGKMFKELLTGKDIDGNDVDAGTIIGHTIYEYTETGGRDAKETNDNTEIGMTENRLPGINNPYKDDYDYADGAYFGKLTEKELENIFEEILDKVQLNSRYDFLLKKDTSVVISDPIGDGMEVKGEPVLRYFGTNSSPTSQQTGTDGDVTYTNYYWSKTVNRLENSDAKADDPTVNLSGIVAKVATNTKTGEQTVTLTIPDNAMPVYYPDLNKNFYYEELPIRLIYRVGLTEAEEEKLKAAYESDQYVEATYYTNKYSDDEAGTTVTFMPDEGNPYYEAMEEGGDAFAKDENTSNTVFYSFAESYDSTTGVVTQRLGNNGVLNISKDNTISINVSKSWDAEDTDHPDYVMVSLYAKGTKTYEDGTKEEFTELCRTEQLDESNNWKHAWEKLPREKVKDGVTYSYDIYYVGETYVEGSYTPVYTDGNGDAIISETLPVKMYVPDFGGTSSGTTTAEAAEVSEAEESTEDAENVSLSAKVMQIPYVWVTYNYSVVNAMNGTVNITNHTAYKLPNSGGIGTKWFTLGALTLCGAALVMYILNKRKNMRMS
jgi:hypothetical protein